jgi:hypothetical protein
MKVKVPTEKYIVSIRGPDVNISTFAFPTKKGAKDFQREIEKKGYETVFGQPITSRARKYRREKNVRR